MTPHLFAGLLVSPGPHPDLRDVDQLFAPFIGSWDLIVSWFDDDGAVTRQALGEWHFAWVLEGRAVQDIWITPRRELRGSGEDLYEYGASVRFPDPELGAWRSTWIGPMQRSVRTFIARGVGDDVVLETTPDASDHLRWSFHAVARDSFAWRNEVFDGAGWRRTQAFNARRQLAS